MNDLMKLSESLQKSIFEYRLDEFNREVIKLTDFLVQELENSIKVNRQDRILNINKIIGGLNAALVSRDYLLFADILKYELETNF